MKVVVSEEIARSAEALLSDHEVFKAQFGTGEFFIHLRDADVLIVRTYTKVNRDLLEKAAKLKYVVRCGVGLENVDVKTCRSRNIKVINAPGSNSDSVAEHTVLMILASIRNLVNSHDHVRGGGWERQGFMGKELRGKTVGLLGFGAIGRSVAKKLGGFGVDIVAYDVFMDEQKANSLGVRPVELDELLKSSDIISVHVPLLESTYHMINTPSIEKMKGGAVIVNTSRGAIIDEEALANALRSGKLSFAALDVFENEPPVGSKFFELDNVLLTPHVAGVTVESFERMCSEPILSMLGDANEH